MPPPDRRTEILTAATRVIARRGVRGLRVAELAKEAGVSVALIYYHFGDRAGLLRRTLEFIGDRAERYTAGPDAASDPAASDPDPRSELEQTLLLELQDTPVVRENSTAWGELRASAVFDPEPREDLAAATLAWVHGTAELLGRAHPGGTAPAHAAAAERLTALLEGLSQRWLSGSIPLEHARHLLAEAVAVELGVGVGGVGVGVGHHPLPPPPRKVAERCSST
ncbi:TetR/AcrR family transcriptional regulator [Streptacidiphilus anmyonensis]|uniref:TetR/AcrR family transcriptional regulator n=1 Tax=Streptacidiphilus anmyonensis TaxID=405782 RepID=UPI0007C67BEA|nr:TetR/AcrR family transcriptional regulator [Streptacidiphilus anmyonensis]